MGDHNGRIAARLRAIVSEYANGCSCTQVGGQGPEECAECAAAFLAAVRSTISDSDPPKAFIPADHKLIEAFARGLLAAAPDMPDGRCVALAMREFKVGHPRHYEECLRRIR